MPQEPFAKMSVTDILEYKSTKQQLFLYEPEIIADR
jgi:hypothetical protein